MTRDDYKKIYSESYADLLVEYNGNENIFKKYKNSTIHKINDKYAVLYISNEKQEEFELNEFGYSVIPACFGIMKDSSQEASGINKLRNVPNLNLRGKGVLIGIVDTGIDYTNPIFQYADKTTKIVSLWDQSIDSDVKYQPDFLYGAEYSREDINAALKSETPFSIVPSKDENGHGTMLAGIAAGSEDPKNEFIGTAPESELIIVKVKPAKLFTKNFYALPEKALCYQENDIMMGVEYLVRMANKLKQPIAICIGLGTSRGAHDGSRPLSIFLSIYGNIPGIATIVAAGNEGNSAGHYYGTIDPATGFDTVELRVGEKEKGFCFEVWGESPNTYTIDILSPGGEYIPRIPAALSESRNITFLFEPAKVYVDYQLVESMTGDQLIFVKFRDPTPGIWKFKIYGKGDMAMSFHIWLPIRQFLEEGTGFIKPNPNTTITTPANAILPLTVTAYNSDDGSLYQNAGKGLNRLGNLTLSVAAPGVNVLAPSVDHSYASASGTSIAAAHMTGIAALMMEWGILRKNYSTMDTVIIKKYIVRGAKRNKETKYPNPDWGYGILDIYQVFETIRSDFIGRSS